MGEIINSFLSGETDAVELLYTKFVSLIASAPSVRTLVPFSASEISQKGDEVFQLTSSGGDFGVERKELDVAEPQEFPNDMIFEQDPLQIVSSLRLLREPPHSKDKHNANHERNLKLWTRKFTLVLIVGQRDGVWNRDLR